MVDGTGMVDRMIGERKRKSKRFKSVLAGLAFCMALTGCGCKEVSYDAFTEEVASESILQPVGTTLNEVSYAGEAAVVQEAEAVFTSEDGLCRIEKKPSYYEIYLDYTGGDYYAVGEAYGETVKKLEVGYAEMLEPFLYENIKSAFPNLNGDYSPVDERLQNLLKGIPEEYRQEMEGFAKAMSDGRTGFEEDGKLSYEEAMIMHVVPDCLRGTNCNAFSAWGEKTETGDRIVSRTLEWNLGSENQMCTAHAVTHFKMPEGKNSYTTFAVLGMLDVLTAVNDDKVFVGILDVGSYYDYVCEGKKCYTYELRYALENMSDARTVGEYMVSESRNFTYSHNIIITDEKDSFVAEDCVIDETTVVEDDEDPAEGISVLRDKDTPLMDDLTWDSPDSLCVINSFMTEGNADQFTWSGGNYVRFSKYNTWVAEKDKLTVSDVKDIVNRETQDRDSQFQKLHSDMVFQNIIYDYHTDELNIAFTGVEGVVNHPRYVKIEIE